MSGPGEMQQVVPIRVWVCVWVVRSNPAYDILVRAALEAVSIARRVGVRRCRLAEQTAQVDEVFLRGRALLQLRCSPLGDERARRHRAHRNDGDMGRLRRPLARLDDAASFIETDTSFPCCSGHHAAVSCDVQVRR